MLFVPSHYYPYRSSGSTSVYGIHPGTILSISVIRIHKCRCYSSGYTIIHNGHADPQLMMLFLPTQYYPYRSSGSTSDDVIHPDTILSISVIRIHKCRCYLSGHTIIHIGHADPQVSMLFVPAQYYRYRSCGSTNDDVIRPDTILSISVIRIHK